MKFVILPVFVNFRSFSLPSFAKMISLLISKQSLKVLILLGFVTSMDFY